MKRAKKKPARKTKAAKKRADVAPSNQRERFDQLLDDAILGVKPKSAD